MIFVGLGTDIHQYSEDSLKKTAYRRQLIENNEQDQGSRIKDQDDGATGSAVEGHSDLPSAICHLKLYGLTWSEYPRLTGDSDADVGLHSIIDALLSGSQKGDIGQRFGVGPNVNGLYDSLAMLKLVVEEIMQDGFRVVNLVSQCICNGPRISKRKSEVQKLLAEVLKTPFVNVSGKTSEGMFGANWSGIYVISNALLEKKD
ncbi:MAG: 2-C-methyl-D-erythritol 2,4-cyclodiphosphate synthase [Bifidobacteriaceae bacterium]|jgi:2-C-methyl-D-erythritol 4-phosphate cytidylyltransferase/2-C-methyl-D-erythritol 2,4-cyclodiphosphate synthase|nr:2-C-methyl-D-erythritol 2,4-cyclodiphosphate synthase [Bifidobacteriaceae bacterium]